MTASLLAAGAAWAADLPVTDAAGLTAALGGAAAGDVVELGPGTYDGQFTVPAGVTLRGAGAESTVLRAVDAGTSVLTADGPSPAVRRTTIEGVTVLGSGVARGLLARQDLLVRGCELLGFDSTDAGAALRAEGALAVELRGVSIAGGHSASDGGLVWVGEGSALTIDGAVFADGRSDGSGGCLQAGSATLTVTDTSFTSCTALDGGGALDLSGSDTTLEAVSIEQGAVWLGEGGAIKLTGGSLRAEGGRLVGNRAAVGGALAAFDGASVDLAGVVVEGNQAVLGGGARVVDAGSLAIRGGRFSRNTGRQGGGLSVSGCCAPTGTGTTAPPSSMTLSRTAFCDNRLGPPVEDPYAQWVYGVPVDPLEAFGAAAVLDGVTAEIRETLWLGNVADYDDEGEGAALELSGTSAVTIAQSVFAWNDARDGGVIDSGDGVTLDVRNTLFARNTSAPVLDADLGTPTAGYLVSWRDYGLVTSPDTLFDATSRATVSAPGLARPERDACLLASWSPTFGSELVDAGDPATTDRDGSRADVGLPFGVDLDTTTVGDTGDTGDQSGGIPRVALRRDCGCAAGVGSGGWMSALMAMLWRRGRTVR